MSEFQDVQEHVRALKADWGRRDDNIDEIKQIFLLQWDEEDDVEKQMSDTMVTLSPDGRDKALGAARLITGANPKFSIEESLNTGEVMKMAADLERVADRLWKAAGRITGDPVHYDEILSMLLFSESHIILDRTEELVRAASGVSDAAAMRAEELAYKTPIFYNVVNPRQGYPELGKYGLEAYHRTVEMTLREFYNDFGEAKGKDMLQDAGMNIELDNVFQKLTVNQYWDTKHRFIWFKGSTDFGYAEPHGMPIIPVVYTRGEGTGLFDEPHEQNQSFLYSMVKSGMWKRANLGMTVFYTLLFALGSLPMIKEKLNQDGDGVTFKSIGAARKAVVAAGADMEVTDLRNIIPDHIMQGVELAERKIEESTIYGQTLGEPLGKNAPFSMVALLHQAGRLPLAATQRKGGWGIAEATKKAMRWLKAEPPERDYSHIFGEDFAFENIPDQFELDATLTLDLPEDLNEKIQQFNALEGKMPTEWRMEKLLEVEDPKQMRKDLWSELKDNQYYQEYVTQQQRQELMAQVQQRMQEEQQAQQEQAQAQQEVQQQQIQQQQQQMRAQQQGQQQIAPGGREGRPIPPREPKTPKPPKGGQGL